ncbi:hypothetical protein RHSP_15224 [Rhizobium freirei PRF 81]|uniref:Uncharacterized protein n=1 Tax=Rhizobium freirei PRF 81 TaxID=363754 RepID=N6V779_9HYPH|nr:hypothetical protein RHSP_15224 [Rhizobium freirei PRF 81]
MQHDEQLQAAEQQPESEHRPECAFLAKPAIAGLALWLGLRRWSRCDCALVPLVAVVNEDPDGFRQIGCARVEHGIYLHISMEA